MDLSIIIVNFNTRSLTIDCVESVFTHLDRKLSFEIIVVDNGSSDGSQQSLQELRRARGGIQVIESGSNLGFAAANNIGMKTATGRNILLLNSDTYLIDDSVMQAMAYLDGQASVFGCGCTLLNADGSVGISYGRFPELCIVFYEAATGRFARLRAVVPRRLSSVYTIDFPCGAFFLIKRDLLTRVGMFDERFFMYCEETDLAKRARKAGYRIDYFGPTRVVHLCGKSSATDSETSDKKGATIDLRVVFYRSWNLYLRKHCTTMEVRLVGILLFLFFKIHELAFVVVRNTAASVSYKKEIAALKKGWTGEIRSVR